jgi:PilZ domain
MMPSSPAPVDDRDPYADRRVYPRVPVALPAFLQANGERHAVQILDVSPGGAKLDCSARLSVGTAVTLDCGTLRLTAVVRWLSGGAMGVCFDSELDAREASALIDRSRAMAAWIKARE